MCKSKVKLNFGLSLDFSVQRKAKSKVKWPSVFAGVDAKGQIFQANVIMRQSDSIILSS